MLTPKSDQPTHQPPTSQISLLDKGDEGDNGRKPRQWWNFLALHRLDCRFQSSRVHTYTSKGKGLLQRAAHLISIDKIPLPFLKAAPDPGQEWVKGVLLCMWGTSTILVLNVVLVIIAMGFAYSRGPDSDKHFDYAELYRGSCSMANGWTTGMHLVINALSTGLLAASNYSMQCLSAPTREDVRCAHARHGWLDIGAFSIRNLRAMDTKRKALWGVLLISSIPIHMLYNSAVFPSITTKEYGIVIVPDDLGRGEALTKDNYETAVFLQQVGEDPGRVHADYRDGAFKQHRLSECFKLYNTEYNTKKSTLLLVADRKYFDGSSSLSEWETLIARHGLGSSIDRLVEYWQTDDTVVVDTGHWNYPDWTFADPMAGRTGNSTWQDYQEFYQSRLGLHDDSDEDIEKLYTYILCHNPGHQRLEDYMKDGNNWNNDSWIQQISVQMDGPANGNNLAHLMDYTISPCGTRVHACFSKDTAEQCQLYFSLPICLAVIVCNIIKVICMYLTAQTDRTEILLTVGDALASFLDTPEGMTKGRCLLSRRDMMGGDSPWCPGAYSSRNMAYPSIQQNGYPFRHLPSQSPGSEGRQRKRYPEHLPGKGWWGPSAGLGPWIWYLSLFFSCLGTSIGLYIAGVARARGRGMDTSMSNIWSLEMGKPTGTTIIVRGREVIALVLLVNSPQLVYSTLYFLSNGLLTKMLLAAEYNDYATERKPLRVSWPKGQQRWTYYISLPYRYGVPLIVVSIVLHWLLSQSLFLVKINNLDVHGNRTKYRSETACSFSLKAMFLTILVGTLAMAVLIGLGFRRLRSDMPVASSCSAAISAACHPPPGDTDASLKPVKWGQIINAQARSQGTNDGLCDDDIFNDEGLSMDGDYRHCSFTSQEVMKPSCNIRYC